MDGRRENVRVSCSVWSDGPSRMILGCTSQTAQARGYEKRDLTSRDGFCPGEGLGAGSWLLAACVFRRTLREHRWLLLCPFALTHCCLRSSLRPGPAQ